eukprot:gnl/Hemi2/23090_TR7741_c0_g2_i1.p1 gnl/Hemi2/23090_TR7741_c0_g2~~gnl/Hemi2/23090_TR7741_c0_g2_i1.p1  ORF type:complete len:556 (-),score=250.01 gnl/Hemi2/23090_TR7741_c0_g2_i1:93-1760(-)
MAYRYNTDSRMSSMSRSNNLLARGPPAALLRPGSVSKSGRGGPLTMEEKRVEGQYVENLQQQVYLLEVELRLLREHALQNQPDAATIAANGSFSALLKDVQDMECKSSEEYMAIITTGLKKIDREFNAKLDKVDKEKAELELANASLHQHISQLKQDMREGRKETDQLKAGHSTEKDALASQAIKRRAKLTTTRQQLASMTEEKERLAQRWKDDALKAQNQIKNQQDQLNGLLQEKRHLEDRCNTLETEFNAIVAKITKYEGAPMEELVQKLTKERDQYKTEKTNLEMAVTQMEVKVRSAQQQRDKYDQDNQALVADSVLLQNKVADLEKADKENKSRIERLEKALEEASKERIKTQTRIAKLKGLAKTQTDEEREVEHNKQTAQLEHDKQFLNEKIQESVEEIERGRNFAADLSKKNSELTHETRVQQARIVELTETLEQNKSKLAEMIEASVALKAEAESMKKKLKLSKTVESLKASDFNNLMNTNLSMARKITQLVKSIQDLGPDSGFVVQDDGSDAADSTANSPAPGHRRVLRSKKGPPSANRASSDEEQG